MGDEGLFVLAAGETVDYVPFVSAAPAQFPPATAKRLEDQLKLDFHTLRITCRALAARHG